MPLNYCPIPLSPPLFTHGKGKPREKGSGLYLKFRRWKTKESMYCGSNSGVHSDSYIARNIRNQLF